MEDHSSQQFDKSGFKDITEEMKQKMTIQSQQKEQK